MELEDRLDKYPEPWRPEPGDKVVGTITELDMLPSKFSDEEYPLVVVATDDGTEVAVHAFHTVLKSELARRRPQVGDRLGVAYHGKDDKASYERYRVVLERARPDAQTVEWGKVAQDAKTEFDSGDVAPDPTDADTPPEYEEAGA